MKPESEERLQYRDKEWMGCTHTENKMQCVNFHQRNVYTALHTLRRLWRRRRQYQRWSSIFTVYCLRRIYSLLFRRSHFSQSLLCGVNYLACAHTMHNAHMVTDFTRLIALRSPNSTENFPQSPQKSCCLVVRAFLFHFHSFDIFEDFIDGSYF